MAERIASVRQNRLRFRSPRPPPKLQASIVIRWKCEKCHTLHLDRSERGPEVYSHRVRPGRTPYSYAATTSCCGMDWVYEVLPMPEHVQAWEREGKPYP